MATHTQANNFLTNGYATLKMPVIKNMDGTWIPRYEYLFKRHEVPRKFYRYHYVQRYYTKGYWHFLWDRLTLKHPQAFRFWIEVTMLNTAETKKTIKELLGQEDVELIETPEKYRFESKEVTK